MMPSANILVALAAGLGVLVSVTGLLVLFGGTLLRAMKRARPGLRVLGIAALCTAPVVLASLTALGVGLFPHASPFDLIAHHCHVSTGQCSAHEAARIPGIAVLATLLLSVLVLARLGWALLTQALELKSTRALLAGSTPSACGQYRVLETDTSWAFAFGLTSPSIYLSRGLGAALKRDECDIVLAHEQAHIFRHDLIVRFGCAVLTAFLPETTRRGFMDALVLAQEEACDAETTRRFSRVRIAETLLKVERLRTGVMPGAMAANFTGSPLESRVRALLEPDYETASLSLARLSLITGSTAFALLLSLELLHHEIETFFMVLGG